MANGITDLGPDTPEQRRQQRERSLYSGVPEHLVPFADSLQAIIGGDAVPVDFRYNRPEDSYRAYRHDDPRDFGPLLESGQERDTRSRAMGFAVSGEPGEIVMYKESFSPESLFSDEYDSARQVLAHEVGHHKEFRAPFGDKAFYDQRQRAVEELRSNPNFPRYPDQDGQVFADAFSEGVRYLQRNHATDAPLSEEDVPAHLKTIVGMLLERPIYEDHPINRSRRAERRTPLGVVSLALNAMPKVQLARLLKRKIEEQRNNARSTKR